MHEVQKMRFWGTSAGEGIPAPFCRCRVCEYAREHGGKDMRTRSCFRIDTEAKMFKIQKTAAQCNVRQFLSFM